MHACIVPTPLLPTPTRILDSLPVAVRNAQSNYISRGFPVGFITPPNYKEVRDVT